jgi:hypothetical protein
VLFARVFVDAALGLYADMLAGLPADEAVPEDCALALQPIVAADGDRCAQSARAFAMMASALPDRRAEYQEIYSKVDWSGRLYGHAIFDPRLSEAWAAQVAAASCGDEAIARFLADEPPRREPVPSRLECISNKIGCFVIDTGKSVFIRDDDDMSIEDLAAHLRLAATLLWLREPAAGSIAERFARRPAQLRSPNHDSGFDAERRVLYVEDLDPRHKGKRFELPVASAH